MPPQTNNNNNKKKKKTEHVYFVSKAEYIEKRIVSDTSVFCITED